MSAFTPGPWKAVPNGGDDDRTEAVYVGTDDELVADCRNVHLDDMGEANARLIAAAPDMLAALEGVLPILEGVNSRCTQDTAMIKNVRTALKAARGES